MESRKFLHDPTDGETTQTAMMEACESGDVAKLQRLLQSCNVEEGDPPVEPKYGEPDPPQSAPPATWKMITSAVLHGQSSILALILKTYPAVKLNGQSILEAALSNPQLETFKLLHAHSPTILNYEFDALNTSLLMEACRNGDPLLPTYLLDNGADTNEGGFPGMGPLFYAVTFEQPLDVIVKMLDCGAVVTNAVVNAAIGKQRYNAIVILLQRGGLKDLKGAIESAHKTGNEKIIALVQEQVGKQSEDVHRGKRGKVTRAKKGWRWF